MEDLLIREKFFYAMQEAGMYDETIEFVVPCYRQMHGIILRLVKDQHSRESASLVLDVGYGTGADSIPLLQMIPKMKLVGVDLCQPMQDVFRGKATSAGIGPERYALMTGDVLEPDTIETIKQVATETFKQGAFDTIISAFTIHHFGTEQKKAIFQLMFDLLKPGGVFILGDLFNCDGESDEMTETILNWEIDWIGSSFREDSQKAKNVGNTERAAKLEELRDKWISHYVSDNKLDSVTTHFQMLEEIGYSEVANPFRHYQVGIVWAKK